MALHDDELNKRQQRREELRKKREQEQKRLKIGLIAAGIILVAAAVAVFVMAKGAPGSEEAVKATTAATTAPTEETQLSWEERTATSTMHIRAAGDLNITDSVVASGLAATGYEFTRSFIDVAHLLAEADLTVMNLEGNICGEPYGTARTSAPKQILESLRSAGVDLVQIANSTSINNGLIGLRSTLQAVHDAGLEPLGAYASNEDFQRTKGYTMCEANGISVAFVAFTKGMSGMGLPAGSENCVNLLYEDYDSEYKKVNEAGITRVLKNAASENPDLTVAMLHWGSEGTDSHSDTQERIIKLMQKNGVDVIIGTHPHRVHKVDFNQAAGTLIAYSLGDFFGDATAGGSNYSIILDIEVTKDNHAGVTRVTGFDYIPIYTQKESECVDGDRRVLRIHEAMYAYENNFVDSVSKACYENMETALGRINDRIKGYYNGVPDPTEAK